MPGKIAIIAALEREIRPLIREKGWRSTRVLRCAQCAYENDAAVVVCAGIGAEPARKAAEETVAVFRPAMLVSAGLAGALTPGWKIGRIMVPARIIASASGAQVESPIAPELPGLTPSGILVSSATTFGSEGKRLLADSYGAQAVDMEAASVADVANTHDVPFVAIKAISDEYDFPMPDFAAFVDRHGRLQTSRFVLHTAIRPRTWSVVCQLASNTSRASRELCRVLQSLLVSGAFAAGQHCAIEAAAVDTRPTLKAEQRH